MVATGVTRTKLQDGVSVEEISQYYPYVLQLQFRTDKPRPGQQYVKKQRLLGPHQWSMPVQDATATVGLTILFLEPGMFSSKISQAYGHRTSQRHQPHRLARETVGINDSTLSVNDFLRSARCSIQWIRWSILNGLTRQSQPELPGIQTNPVLWSIHTGLEENTTVAGIHTHPKGRWERARPLNQYTRGPTIRLFASSQSRLRK